MSLEICLDVLQPQPEVGIDNRVNFEAPWDKKCIGTSPLRFLGMLFVPSYFSHSQMRV